MVASMQAATSKPVATQAAVKLEVRDLSISYGKTPALSGVSLDIREHEIFGIIGPANAGKTSFLKTLNRMNMFNSNMHVDGEILFNGRDIRHLKNVYALRSRIGVVFPLPEFQVFTRRQVDIECAVSLFPRVLATVWLVLRHVRPRPGRVVLSCAVPGPWSPGPAVG